MNWKLPAIGSEQYDSGAQAHITVTAERQERFFKWYTYVMAGTWMTALGLAQIQADRLYVDAGFKSMNEFLERATSISRTQGQLYIKIAQTFEANKLTGEDGLPTPLALLGVEKLGALSRTLTPKEIEELQESGEFLGPDDKFYTIEQLVEMRVPDLKQELKKLRRQSQGLDEALRTAKAEVKQLREERAEGKTAENLVKEMDELRIENMMLKGERDKGEAAWKIIHAAQLQIEEGVQVLERWRLSTLKDYNEDPITFQKIAGICGRFGGRMVELEHKIATLAAEAAAED